MAQNRKNLTPDQLLGLLYLFIPYRLTYKHNFLRSQLLLTAEEGRGGGLGIKIFNFLFDPGLIQKNEIY